MFSPLANPTYRQSFAAQALSLLGTGLATVALGLLAFDTLALGDTAGDASIVRRVSAAEIETAVVDQVRALLRQPEIVVGT